jgi:uncharacterized protein YjbI with pentapeptide repeats
MTDLENPFQAKVTAAVLQILERYEAGQRLFIASELDDQVHDFENTNLVGADFSNSFIFASFKNANLENANFTNANIKTCDFTNANLRGACFHGALLEGTIFDGANLECASFAGASVFNHYFAEGELPIQNQALE